MRTPGRENWPRTSEWSFRELGRDAAELARMAGRWHTSASRTDRDRGCAQELEEVLHDTTLEQLRMLAVRWHALAHLSHGDHACADELDHWVAGRAHSATADNTPRPVTYPTSTQIAS